MADGIKHDTQSQADIVDQITNGPDRPDNGGKINPEDLLLYVFCFLLMVFLGGYFVYITNLNENEVQGKADARLLDNLLIRSDTVDNTDIAFLKSQLLQVQTRYRFFHKLARTKAHIKYVGFLVGTLLTVLGSMVVIRGVRDSGNNLEVSGVERAKVKLTTSSPGIFIAAIGGAIILSTILGGNLASVNDGAIVYPGDNAFYNVVAPIQTNDSAKVKMVRPTNTDTDTVNNKP